MSHKERRAASYRARGMKDKALIAAVTANNRSKRARGKLRQAVQWQWRGAPGARFADVRRRGALDYPVSW